MAQRATWQQERRAETRDRLLESAHKIFSRLSYAGTTVNDILAEADVGRTSFYKHFTDKLAVAQALFEDLMPDLSEAYASIADASEIDEAAIARWITELIARYRRNAPIMTVFAQVQAIEPDFGVSVVTAQRNIMSSLGRRFPTFARAAVAPDTLDRDYTRATLLIDTIDHLCSTVAIRQVPIDEKEAVSFTSEFLARFLEADG